jgi:hypothetical protein
MRGSMPNADKVIEQITKLTGQPVPFEKNIERLRDQASFEHGGIGRSQLNEILLTLGYDRIKKPFFTYLFGESLQISNYNQFVHGIEKFRKEAILLYGNVKFAFKKLSNLEQKDLDHELAALNKPSPSEFISRHRGSAPLLRTPD